MSKPTKPLVIGVSGPSASGKTKLIDNLATRISGQSISILREDSYYLDQSHKSFEARAQLNFDHPDAIEHDLMELHLNQLIEKKEVETPQYDFHEHQRDVKTTTIKPTSIIILDGILILTQPAIRKLIDISVYVDTPLDICLLRRIERDTVERSRSVESILHQYQDFVRPMYWQFIEPNKMHADIIITGGGNNWTAIELIQSRIEKYIGDIVISK